MHPQRKVHNMSEIMKSMTTFGKSLSSFLRIIRKYFLKWRLLFMPLVERATKMVYMHFPNHLTEEEEFLQKKYAKLKRKKQALKAMRAPKPEPVQPADEAKKRSYEEAAEATEEAKKLIKSGVIKLGERKGQREFKRTKRQKDTDRSTVAFQPFQASLNSDQEEEKPETSGGAGGGPGVRRNTKKLYDSFISSRESRFEDDERKDREHGRDREDRRRDRRDSDREPPKKGNTIYVHGIGVSEELIRKTFSNSGTLVNITMEQEKNCGFVTFEKMDEAEEAIAQMNGSMVQDVQLKVSMARRQPTFEQSADPSTASWAATAASKSQKGSHKDKRDLVIYDDEDIF